MQKKPAGPRFVEGFRFFENCAAHSFGFSKMIFLSIFLLFLINFGIKVKLLWKKLFS
jgi:hypothetical protein